MRALFIPPAPLRPAESAATAVRIARSALTPASAVADLDRFDRWYAERSERDVATVERIPLDDLVGWHGDPDTGNIRHESGKFFTVEGFEVRMAGDPVPEWDQPIIVQPEIGILGILVKEIDGVLHFLMQAKNEPGNPNGVQLSPTVQATRSNYTRVHRGDAVPYLQYFQNVPGYRAIADVLQSEQGSWFFGKRNRNMVVEVDDDVPVHSSFHWLTLGALHRLHARDNVVNMDARTVLSCLPFTGSGLAETVDMNGRGLSGGGLPAALLRSCSDEQGGVHTTSEILSWITEARTRSELRRRTIPLNAVGDWERTPRTISHKDGRYFDVMAVDVRAHSREVRQWTQPMFQPCGVGVVAFLAREIAGVLHVLVHARAERGYRDLVELAPTVVCTPGNYPAGDTHPAHLRHLDEVLAAGPDRILFDTILSEEGGRFYHAENRYVVVTTDGDHGPAECPEFRWLTLHQLAGLLRHSHTVDVEARSLVTCLYSLLGAG